MAEFAGIVPLQSQFPQRAKSTTDRVFLVGT
jgi:hypothetical protein